MARLSADSIVAGLAHLTERDEILGGIIQRVGPFLLKPDRDRFGSLARAILSQQISVQAARTIRGRLEAMVAPDKITAESLARLTPEQYRAVGVSGQKGRYLLDLAAKVQSGEVNLKQIARRTDDEVIAELTQVKGIGVWTAQMFLIFSLGRLDVFPHEDLGVRMALRKFYGLPELPNREQSYQIAEKWRPYASIASWYCWRSGDLRDTTAE